MGKTREFGTNSEAGKGKDQGSKPTIVFVYNADSGFLNALKDYVHKIVSPKTYACNLCAVTFGNLGMKKHWKKFVANLDFPVEFLHRDEFLERYHLDNVKFPSAYIERGTDINLFITQEEINSSQSLDVLMQLVTKKINEIREEK